MQFLSKLLVIDGGVAIGRGHKVVFIRDEGQIHPTAGVLQVSFVEIPEALRRMVKGSSIHGVFQLGQMISHPVQAVIIPLTQQPCGGKCFERTELIPQRELIGGVVLKAIGKGAGKQRLAGEGRQLRQGAALRIGGGIGGLDGRPEGKADQKNAQQHRGQNNSYTILLHTAPP